MRWAGEYLKTKYNVDQFPIGAVKGTRGVVTLTGGWVDQYSNAITDANKEKYQKLLLVFKMRDGKPSLVAPDADDDKVYTILCCRYVMALSREIICNYSGFFFF